MKGKGSFLTYLFAAELKSVFDVISDECGEEIAVEVARWGGEILEANVMLYGSDGKALLESARAHLEKAGEFRSKGDEARAQAYALVGYEIIKSMERAVKLMMEGEVDIPFKN